MKVSKSISIEFEVLEEINKKVNSGNGNSISEFIQKAVEKYLET